MANGNDSKTKYLTPAGLAKLKTELIERQDVTRKKIADAISRAREKGDVSDNSEYESALNEQDMNERRIIEIQNILNTHTVVEKSENGNQVNLGHTVHVKAESGDLTFKLVGSEEANPEKGYVSAESPLGQALMGKKTGEIAKFEAPAGTINYKILKIE